MSAARETDDSILQAQLKCYKFIEYNFRRIYESLSDLFLINTGFYKLLNLSVK